VHMDIFLVSKIVDTSQAALYSSVSLVAKFIFFICAAIEIYFYNNIIDQEDIYRGSLLRPLFIFGVLGVAGLGGIGILGGIVLDLFKP